MSARIVNARVAQIDPPKRAIRWRPIVTKAAAVVARAARPFYEGLSRQINWDE
jgi:hypothetical protein